MRTNGLTWSSYLQVAGGLMGLTWGLNRLRRDQNDWLAWTVTGLSAPLTVGGLSGWLPLPKGGNLVRQAIPALARSLV